MTTSMSFRCPLSSGQVFALAAFFSLALPASVIAHSESEHGAKATKSGYSNPQMHEFGKAADPGKAARTIVVSMSDEMRFTPAEIEVERGEVVRFEILNEGQLLHEMVLGTDETLEKHAVMMRNSPDMKHEELYMAHVPPSKKVHMGWQFTNAGVFYYACLIPGHLEAGMKGKITVR